MRIPKLKIQGELRAEDVPQLMIVHGVAYQPISCVNWPEAYPYAPRVEVALAHTGSQLLVHYRVEEICVRAIAEKDGGRVWEDSCCELFLQPSASYKEATPYYNIECNCAGTLLIAVGKDRHARQPASENVMKGVLRWSSLAVGVQALSNGRRIIPRQEGDFDWHMALVIPATTFFANNVIDLSGLVMRGNLYKCGDQLAVPHFLSYFPIDTPQPDFHRPEFFGEVVFE